MKDTVFNKMPFLWMAAGYGSENSDEEQPRSGSLLKALSAGTSVLQVKFPCCRHNGTFKTSQFHGVSVDFGSGFQRSQSPFARPPYLRVCGGAGLCGRHHD